MEGFQAVGEKFEREDRQTKVVCGSHRRRGENKDMKTESAKLLLSLGGANCLFDILV